MVVLGEVFKCFGGGICSFLVWAYGGLSLGIVLSFFGLDQGNGGAIRFLCPWIIFPRYLLEDTMWVIKLDLNNALQPTSLFNFGTDQNCQYLLTLTC